MKISITSVWAVLVLVLSACSFQRKVVEVKTTPTPPTLELAKDQVAISFEQTACFGTCPVHKMVIYGQGHATYHADRHTKKQGDFIAGLTPEQMIAIFKKANELSFFELEDEYTGNITDLPTTVIYLNDGTRKKKVTAYYDYPENLKEFIKYLSILTQETEWNSAE
tara:strand:+ start:75138 stop:75635 length:498 start_codon:yes stop_codon:yes gene_type:complete